MKTNQTYQVGDETPTGGWKKDKCAIANSHTHMSGVDSLRVRENGSIESPAIGPPDPCEVDFFWNGKRWELT